MGKAQGVSASCSSAPYFRHQGLARDIPEGSRHGQTGSERVWGACHSPGVVGLHMGGEEGVTSEVNVTGTLRYQRGGA